MKTVVVAFEWIAWLLLVESIHAVHVEKHHKKIKRLRKRHKQRDAYNIPSGNHLTDSVAQAVVPVQVDDSTLPSPAYGKCRGILDSHLGDDATIDKSEFVGFLNELSEGLMDAASFEDVGPNYADTFYRTACPMDLPCDNDHAVITLEDTEEGEEAIIRFCSSIMDTLMTEIGMTFSYNIRYDTDSVSEDVLPTCLEAATTNMLLHNFGCETSLQLHRGRRRLSLRGKVWKNSHQFHGSQFDDQRFLEQLLLREAEAGRFLDTAMSMDSSCDYMINTEVSNIIPLGCLPPAPPDANISCGLVRSTVTASAPQSLQPLETNFRTNVTEALRLAIDGDTFEDFFPEDCLFQRL